MRRGSIFAVAAVAVLVIMLGAAALVGAALTQDTFGKTTVEQRIGPATLTPGFRELALIPGGEGYTVREEGVGTAKAGREARRTSMTYFGQLSDFQLADEESPARAEFAELLTGEFASAFRPGEVVNPHIDDATIRQMNAFINRAPIANGNGSRPKMGFTIETGDLADSQQRNETEWVRTLLEGGLLNPNSGVDPATPGATTGGNGQINPLCNTSLFPGTIPGAAEAALYTGVQDTDDFAASTFYDPDLASQPTGRYDTFPQIPGLLDRAQVPFTATGLGVPSYIAFGNHDALVQGNVAAKTIFETVATGCIKPQPVNGFFPDGSNFAVSFDEQDVLDLRNMQPNRTILTPPDPLRRFVSKREYKNIFRSGEQSDGHGFDYVDAATESASNGSAGYYSFSPEPGVRMISLDTVSEGGALTASSEGNIDDPQFRWLEEELKKATTANEVVILFSHHAITSLRADVTDEIAPACSSDDIHLHDVNPGCDLDPRNSAPIHLGADMTTLLHRYPHVIGWVAGHSHVNRVEAYPNPSGTGGFWQVRVAAEADWPQQARLLQLFDNEDGTLSLFGTIIDHASNATAPTGSAASFDANDLASVGRTLGYNDPDAGARGCGATPCGEGSPGGRNVELLIADPRRGPIGSTGLKPGRCTNRQLGTGLRNSIRGTIAGDKLVGRGGKDRLNGLAGKDCLFGGAGNDVAKGGDADDSASGGAGNDRLDGGKGRDKLTGGAGNDRISARDGKRDAVLCGAGKRDFAKVDGKDRVRGCERVRRPKGKG